MDSETSSSLEDLSVVEKDYQVLSEYYRSLEPHVKRRYLLKTSAVGVDPATLLDEQCDADCIPPVESMDLVSYLVLTTSYYTKEQFKAYKSLQAYNQMVSGFVTNVRGRIVKDNYVVLASVRHSQRMNDALVSVWLITSIDGTILSSHCLGCKAGLSESCSHIASVLFYLEAYTRINDKLSCTQVKCAWLLPSFVKEVPYAKIADINLTSARKMKADLDKSIDSLSLGDHGASEMPSFQARDSQGGTPTPTRSEMDLFYSELSKCETKAVALSLIKPHAEAFVKKSRNVPTVSDFFDRKYLAFSYPDLLTACSKVKIQLSESDMLQIEQDTRSQAKGSGFFKHRAGRIGASLSGAVCHTNPALPSQSLIKSICYPHLFKVTTKAVLHGCQHEKDAILHYETEMKKNHRDFQVKDCGTFINRDYQFLHATPDFLCSCSCCGEGCGEVKCPICIEGSDFESYLSMKATCLEKVNGVYRLKRKHNYYYQVQQQLFSANKDLGYCDFVVCAVCNEKDTAIVQERIYKDHKHWDDCLPKLITFWKTCILPEVLGRWYTRRITSPEGPSTSNLNSICFCRMDKQDTTATCANPACLYVTFHHSCLAISTSIPPTWYCPLCRKLPQFQKKKGKPKNVSAPAEALSLSHICVCKAKAESNAKLLECHNVSCSNGKFFHLGCLNYKRLPNNSKSTWQCPACRGSTAQFSSHWVPNLGLPPTPPTQGSPGAIPRPPTQASLVEPCIPTPTQGSLGVPSSLLIQKAVPVIPLAQGALPTVHHAPTNTRIYRTPHPHFKDLLGELDSNDYNVILSINGWLHCSIIQQAHVLLQEVNPMIEGFQRPTLGPIRNFTIMTGEFIQILHTGNQHWVCVSSVGCLPGMVNLYDSLFHDIIETEVEEQVKSMMAGAYKGLQNVPVQQQNNGSDCGVFAIAFATCLVYGIKPEDVDFDIRKMRPHLLSCFKNKKMSLFPTII